MICFSKYYVWGGVGINYFICGFCFLWVNVAKTIVNAMWNGEWQKTQLNMGEMVCCISNFTDQIHPNLSYRTAQKSWEI